MGLINFPNVNQTQKTQKTPTNNSGCLRRIIVLLAVAFVAYYLLKSCGGGLLNYGNGTSYEQRNSPSSNDNTITMPDMTPNSTTNTTNTTNNSGDYSWIVGTWDCDMGAYGKVVMNFEGDGTSGRCSELKPDGTYKYGTYQVNGNVLSYKLTGESFSSTINIESGHRLSDGDGQYYRKRN